ncbi:MAG: molybdopterin molybdotransferase MoeA [Candidatus Hydrothermarchaeaceae archaeon]
MKKLVHLDESEKLLNGLRKKYYFNRNVEIKGPLECLDRELALDLVSRDNSPAHNIASFDGYAISHRAGYPMKIMHSIYAGDERGGIPRLKKGNAMYIATGAYMPEGADAVLRIEDAKIEGDSLYGIPIKAGTKVVRAGSNYKKGETVLRKGQRLRPQEIGIIHGMGILGVQVYKKPKVAVFSTGDEICKGLLRDTNGPMAAAFLKECGCHPVLMKPVPDSLEKIKKRLLNATKYDAIITSGGVSVGRRDFVVKAIKELGTLLMHKVKTRPGKPLTVGIVNDTPVFGLPGKSTGAFVALELNLRNYFLGGIKRPKKVCKISRSIKLSTIDADSPDFINVVFVNLKNGSCVPMGFNDSPMKLVRSDEPYNVSTIASSLRSACAEGYVLVKNDLKKGEDVEVNLI